MQVCQDSFNLWFMMSPEVMILKYHTRGYSTCISELHQHISICHEGLFPVSLSG